MLEEKRKMNRKFNVARQQTQIKDEFDRILERPTIEEEPEETERGRPVRCRSKTRLLDDEISEGISITK